jgi:hypothetical protein
MKKIIAATIFLVTINCASTFAQCAMCKRTAETDMESKNKPSAGKSLNSGILYLLSVPYLIGAVGAIVWFKNRRKGD